MIHNGQKEKADGLYVPDGFLDGPFSLMSLDQVLNEWKMWRKLVDAGEFKGQTSRPDKGVCADWWNQGWLPILSDGGGDSLCVDLAPAKGGALGQIIRMSHESPKRALLAPSFAALLEQLTDYWDSRL